MQDVVVLMPFSEAWSTNVWEALEKISIRDTGRQINIYRVDMKTTPDEWLANHIERIDRKAEIVVADLTNQNPNVLIEVGLALSLEKPLLLISQDRKFVPTHLKGRIVETYDVDDENSMERLITNIYLRIKEILTYLEIKKTDALAREHYTVECFANRRIVHIEKYFREAKERIDILTTNLSFLFNEYNESGKKFFDDIQWALDKQNSKTKIRILTLDPESNFAAKRGKQLGYAPRVFRDRLRKALKNTREISAKYETEIFEVRTYDDFPNQIMYRMDNNIFHCVVAQPTQSRRHMTFKLDRFQSGVETSFTEHFQSIWGQAT